MANSIQELRRDLTQIRDVLGQASPVAFSPEERQSFVESSRKLLKRVDALAESFLTVGLLGGTGVGKSSIMNALAGAQISSASHRRPHTDRVVIYRHKDAQLPPIVHDMTVPWQEIIHEADAVRHVVLCDLPDFDSLMGEHHQRVVHFLEHLDVLTWVVSPEKYADARFYGFLKNVPKARQNFYFVLNKADRFFDGESVDEGYRQLARVTGSFQHHLGENGISHPLIYAVSATEVTASGPIAPWNQFASLRHQIFHQREAKEVLAIKSANLDVEVARFVESLEQRMAGVEALRHSIQLLSEELEARRGEWTGAGRRAFDAWLNRHLDENTSIKFTEPTALVGPGRIIAALAQELKRWSRGGNRTKSLTALFLEDNSTTVLRLQLEGLKDRMAQRLLLDGLSPFHLKRLEEVLNVDREWDGFTQRLQGYMDICLTGQKPSPSPRFVASQYVVYSVIFVFFVIALGGEATWVNLISHPHWSDLAGLFFALILSVYSPLGLAALLSLLLLYTIFGFRFYGRYKKYLQHWTQKFIESLKSDLAKIWEEELDSIIARLNEYDQELEMQISAVSEIYETRRKVF